MIWLGTRSLDVFTRNTRVDEAGNASMDRGCLFLAVLKSLLLLTFLSHQRFCTYNLFEIHENEPCGFFFPQSF